MSLLIYIKYKIIFLHILQAYTISLRIFLIFTIASKTFDWVLLIHRTIRSLSSPNGKVLIDTGSSSC